MQFQCTRLLSDVFMFLQEELSPSVIHARVALVGPEQEIGKREEHHWVNSSL